jgi:hypothetical protein
VNTAPNRTRQPLPRIARGIILIAMAQRSEVKEEPSASTFHTTDISITKE